MTHPDRRQRLEAAQLYVLVDGRESKQAFETFARALIDAGVDVLQLRDKHLADRQLLERARTLRQFTRSSATLLVINDRPDIAVLSEADGVHVGQEELPVADVRRLVGPEILIGLSTHSVAQAEDAVAQGADYIGCGPVFPSTTKEFASFPGVELVSAVCQRVSLPAFAIGGVRQENLPQLLACGCRRIVVGGALAAADNPAAEVRRLRQMLTAGQS